MIILKREYYIKKTFLLVKRLCEAQTTIVRAYTDNNNNVIKKNKQTGNNTMRIKHVEN